MVTLYRGVRAIDFGPAPNVQPLIVQIVVNDNQNEIIPDPETPEVNIENSGC